MPERRVGRWAAAAGGACVAAVVAVVAVAAGGDAPAPSAVPFDGRSPIAGEGRTIRVLFELRRPSLGERMAGERMEPARQRAYVRSLTRETDALRSSLAARAVRLRDVVRYERVWNGFAATIRTEDLPRVQTLGVRVERVRRFYPASQHGRPGDTPRGGGPAGGEATDVALLDSGVDVRHPALRGRVTVLHDAVGGNARHDVHGTQVAGVLAAGLGDRGRILAIRVAGVQRREDTGTPEEAGTTDQLLEGLERAVDPDGDGDVEDAVPVALVGVSSPYAGFAGAPEAEAAAGAAGAGTLVVAPAGNEGPRVGRFGTIGSPGAAPAVLAVGALEGGDGSPALPTVRVGLAAESGRAALDGRLLGGGDGGALSATATGLTGPSQADPEGRARPAGDDPLQYFAVDARPRARGRLVVVPAGPPAAAVAVAARAAGAAGVVICDPDGGDLRGVPRSAAGDLPVIGLSGEAAERALELTAGGDAAAFVSKADPAEAHGDARLAPASSEGPTYALTPKPDLAAPGTARAPVRGGGRALAAGTSFAAARVAAQAARLRRARPGWSASEAAAAIVGTGSLVPDVAAAAAAPLLARPHTVAFPRGRRGTRRVTLRNPGSRPVSAQLEARVDGVDVAVEPARVTIPPRRSRRVTLRMRARPGTAPGFHTGTLSVRAGDRRIRVRVAAPTGPAPPAPLGPLRLVHEGGRVRGVRFTAGAVRREGRSRAVLPLGSLTLTLIGPDVRRELTPPGGATDLLPGEYAYTLTGETLRELPDGTYRFAARARGPGRAERALERSERFEIGG